MTPSEQSYCEIPLSQGMVTRVSPRVFEYLNQWKWCLLRTKSSKNGNLYAIRRMRTASKNTCVLMHRLILGLDDSDKRQCDHVNGDGLDNRDENLRIVSASQNMINRYAGNNRGLRKRRNGRYSVRIKVRGTEYHVCEVDTEHEARLAYAVAAKILHGSHRHHSILSPEQISAQLRLLC